MDSNQFSFKLFIDYSLVGSSSTAILSSTYYSQDPGYLFPKVLTHLLSRVLTNLLSRVLAHLLSRVLAHLLSRVLTNLLSRVLTNLLSRVPHTILGKLMQGIPLDGYWVCFDDAQLMNREAMSVLLDCAATLFSAVRQTLDSVHINGVEVIRNNSHCIMLALQSPTWCVTPYTTFWYHTLKSGYDA